ncbi:MAG: STAS domain-containing protein [Candidatus Omnitrophica bacterium]|nr:STAS domain-containing protein [Candidatus Omnitrophota bacterium]
MVEYRVEGEKLTCRFLKRMDTEVCEECESELFEKIGQVKSATFDLKDVDYISSMFLSICLRASKALGAGNLSIINLHPNVKKVLKIADLDKQVTIE